MDVRAVAVALVLGLGLAPSPAVAGGANARMGPPITASGAPMLPTIPGVRTGPFGIPRAPVIIMPADLLMPDEFVTDTEDFPKAQPNPAGPPVVIDIPDSSTEDDERPDNTLEIPPVVRPPS